MITSEQCKGVSMASFELGGDRICDQHQRNSMAVLQWCVSSRNVYPRTDFTSDICSLNNYL